MRRTLLAAALLALAAAPAAQAAFPGTDVLTLSQGPSGPGNAPSLRPTISHDKRFGRLAAFDSTATNLVAGAGPTSNVYVVHRADPYGDDGTPWSAGKLELVSVGMNGAAADGPSWGAALDGDSRTPPHCVAFVSAADNLVPGDTNGKPDAFVRDLGTGRTIRVSVSATGQQSTGSVSSVSIDGRCKRVAFVSDGGDLALTGTRNPSWKSAVTQAPPAGTAQVYVHALGGSTLIDKAMKGVTFLASATTSGHPAAGNASAVALTANGAVVTFATDGSLASGDANGLSDIYQRTLTPATSKKKYKRHKYRYLVMANRLVSGGGSGASTQPATNAAGTIVAFTTHDPSLIGAASSFSQVVQNDNGTTHLASFAKGGAPGNGDSSAPTVSYGGSWVGFQTDASDVAQTAARRPDPNQVTDAVLWTQATGDRWLLGEVGASTPTTNPQMSSHGNYFVFERGGQAQLLYVGAK